MKRIIKKMLLFSIICINICLIGCNNITVEKYNSNAIVKKYYNEWVEEDGSKYYYNEYGQKQMGWIQYGGDWYYLDPTNGKMLKDQWVDIDYYVDVYGRMLINTTKEINGITYIFDKDGKSILQSKQKKSDYELIINYSFPKTFRLGGSYYWHDIIIENVSYELKDSYGGGKHFEVYYTGMAGNASEGSSYSVERTVGWKLYDPNGYAVDSGRFSTDAALKQGEKFKNNSHSSIQYYSLKEKGTYRLELINLDR